MPFRSSPVDEPVSHRQQIHYIHWTLEAPLHWTRPPTTQSRFGSRPRCVCRSLPVVDDLNSGRWTRHDVISDSPRRCKPRVPFPLRPFQNESGPRAVRRMNEARNPTEAYRAIRRGRVTQHRPPNNVPLFGAPAHRLADLDPPLCPAPEGLEPLGRPTVSAGANDVPHRPSPAPLRCIPADLQGDPLSFRNGLLGSIRGRTRR